jgi:hypothetical protein
MDIHLNDLEQAINFWRSKRPSIGEERRLSPEVDVLATVYALMIFNRTQSLPLDALEEPSRQLIEAWHSERG